MSQGRVGDKRPLGICAVFFPMPSAAVIHVFQSSLSEILKPLCDTLYIVAGNVPEGTVSDGKVRMVDVRPVMHFRHSVRPAWWSLLLQFLKIIAIQMRICWALLKIASEVNIVIFYAGGANLVPALVVGKMLRKKVVLAAMGLGSMSYQRSSGTGSGGIPRRLISIALAVFERVNFLLADQILVASKSSASFLGLDRYQGKVKATGARYVDMTMFRLRSDLRERRNVIGYVGRMSWDKGVVNLLQAMRLISNKHGSIEFLVAGQGPLYQRVRDEVESAGLRHRVRLVGWISHDDELPDYLNELKLLVLPSYVEGLPTIVLEAMACGVPVLATQVGSVADVIRDGETGFLLDDNSPECIADGILRVLDHPNLEQVSRNARALVEREYTYEAAVQRYARIVQGLVGDLSWDQSAD